MANQKRKNIKIIYKPLTDSDIEDAIRLHQVLIPSVGARMGAPYLRKLYTTLLEHPAIHLVFGAFENKQLVGIISATNNFSTTMRLLNKRFVALVPTVLFGLIRNRYSLKELIAHAKVDSQIKQLFNNNSAYILNIAVDPQVQHRGIATQLVQKVQEKWNIKKIILVDTQKSNVSAHKFYKKIGFVPVFEVADSIIFQQIPA